MIPYIVISFYNSKELLDLFFKGSNLILSMGLLPIILLYNKLLLKSASKKTEKNIKKVIIPAAVLVIGLIISSVLIFTIPAWTKNNPMEIIVYQKVYENTVSTKIEAPIKLSNNIKAVLRNPPDINSKNFFTDAFKKTDISFVEYSERKIAEIITLSKLNNKAIEIKIKSDNAFPVYESNLEFERENDKKTVGFIFPQNPPNPLLLSFTSDKNANLDITIKHWSYENPFNTEIENLNLKNVSIKFIMEIQESFKLSNGDLSK